MLCLVRENGMKWKGKELMKLKRNNGVRREDMKENEGLQIVYNENYEENGYGGEWSMASQIGGFDF